MHTVMNVPYLCVVICVCWHAYLRNHTSKIRQILFACYEWPWPGLPTLPSFDSIAICYVLSLWMSLVLLQLHTVVRNRRRRNWCRWQKCNNVCLKAYLGKFAPHLHFWNTKMLLASGGSRGRGPLRDRHYIGSRSALAMSPHFSDEVYVYGGGWDRPRQWCT